MLEAAAGNGGELRLRTAQGQPQAMVWMGFLCTCPVLPAPQEVSGPAATSGCGVCWAICKHENITRCPTQRFWGRKGGSGDQEQARAPGSRGQPGRCLTPRPPRAIGMLWERAQTFVLRGRELPAPDSTGKQKGAPQGGCYLGELSEPAPPGHCCFSSA